MTSRLMPPTSTGDDGMLPLSPRQSLHIAKDANGKNGHEFHNDPSMRLFDDHMTDAYKEWTLRGRVEKQVGRLRAGFDKRRRTYDFLDWVAVFLPCVGWLRTYSVCST
jgi:hypothetical protein